MSLSFIHLQSCFVFVAQRSIGKANKEEIFQPDFIGKFGFYIKKLRNFIQFDQLVGHKQLNFRFKSLLLLILLPYSTNKQTVVQLNIHIFV